MRVLSIRRGNFHGVAYSADGRFLVSLNSRSQVRFWELGTFTQRLALKLPPAAWSHGNFRPCGERLVVGSTLWDVAPAWEYLRRPGEGRPPEPLATQITLDWAEARPSYALTATPDGRRLAGLSWWQGWTPRPRVEVWDDQGRSRKRFPVSNVYLVGVALAPDGRTLAVTAHNKAVALFDLEAEKEAAQLAHTDHPKGMLFSPDGRLLAVAAGRKVWLWDVAARKPLASFPAFQRYAEALAFSPDGKLLAAGSREGQLRLWDAAGCKELACLDWKIGAVHGLAFSPDGMTVAAAGHNNALVIWDVE
jgi:WD40 repeat protein